MATDDELRLRHLADVHSVVVRLSQNSFVIRGWSVTLVSLVFAIISTRTDGSHALVLVAVPPALIFWVLDAYYLRQERLFRSLYAAVGGALARQAGDPDEVAELSVFDMTVDRFTARVPGLVASMFAGHVFAIPVMLTALVIGYVLITTAEAPL